MNPPLLGVDDTTLPILETSPGQLEQYRVVSSAAQLHASAPRWLELRDDVLLGPVVADVELGVLDAQKRSRHGGRGRDAAGQIQAIAGALDPDELAVFDG